MVGLIVRSLDGLAFGQCCLIRLVSLDVVWIVRLNANQNPVGIKGSGGLVRVVGLMV